MKLEKNEYFTDDCLVQNQLSFSFKDSLICPLCNKILKNPFMCNKCQNSYCKKCLDYCFNFMKCPNHNEKGQFNISIMKSEMLSKLKYKCKNCLKEVIQSDIKTHLEENCKKAYIEDGNSLAKINSEKRTLIRLSNEEMKDKKVNTSLTSKINFIIQYFAK